MKALQILAILCALAVLPAWADDKPGKGKKEDKQARKAEKRDERQFSEREREEISGYCRQIIRPEGKRQRLLPPGLAKKVARGDKLPWGWEKKLIPGEIVPIEVYQECHPLPRELTLRLPVPPVGTVTVAVEGRIIRVLEKTREILDILHVPVPF